MVILLGEEVINNFTFYVQWYDVDSNTEDYENLTTKDILDNYNDVTVSKNSDINDTSKPITTIPLNLKVTQILE